MPPKKKVKQTSVQSKPSTSGRKSKRETEGDDQKGKQKKLSRNSDDGAGTSAKTTVSKSSKTKSGWNLKISSWNINGLRSCVEKDGFEFVDSEQPDILCLQETKCSEDKLPPQVKNLEGYHCYWTSGDKAGYAGVGLLSKRKPIKVQYGIGNDKYDDEGRVIMAEYDNFFLVTAYVPNSGRGLVRLDFRMEWDEEFHKFLDALKCKKHVILCGDLNVAHEEIDIANPKTNKKNAGFTKEERESFSTLLNRGYVDSFRYLYPELRDVYTFWTYMRNARANNVGWRLDYFVLSESLIPHLKDNIVHNSIMGSDHCPISLLMSM